VAVRLCIPTANDVVDQETFPELSNATLARLVVPSKKDTEPDVTATPPLAAVTDAVSATEAPLFAVPLDKLREVAVAAGLTGGVVELDEPPPQPKA
jgi:hypothetical protein